MAKPWTGWSTSATNSTRPDRNEHMSNKKAWFISGASRGMGVDFARFAWRHGLLRSWQ